MYIFICVCMWGLHFTFDTSCGILRTSCRLSRHAKLSSLQPPSASFPAAKAAKLCFFSLTFSCCCHTHALQLFCISTACGNCGKLWQVPAFHFLLNTPNTSNSNNNCNSNSNTKAPQTWPK